MNESVDAQGIINALLDQNRDLSLKLALSQSSEADLRRQLAAAHDTAE